MVAAAAAGQDDVIQKFIDGSSLVFADALTAALEGAMTIQLDAVDLLIVEAQN